MFGRAQKSERAGRPGAAAARPERSAAAARARSLVAGADTHGGIERYMDALKLKSAVFREALATDRPGALRLDVESFRPLCSFMPTDAAADRALARGAVVHVAARRARELLERPTTPPAPTARIARFCAAFPQDDRHRWTRDLAVELLHNLDPERYPLMTRWVWDAEANTRAARDLARARRRPPDHRRARRLRDLPGAARGNRAVPVHQRRIPRRGPRWWTWSAPRSTRSTSASRAAATCAPTSRRPRNPMQHTRRLLGLDGVRAATGARASRHRRRGPRGLTSGDRRSLE